MSKLDTPWAIEEIDAFLSITDRVGYDNSGGNVFIVGTHMRGSDTEASQRAHVVEQILDRVLPGWSRDRPKKDVDYDWLRDLASRAKVALQRSAEFCGQVG